MVGAAVFVLFAVAAAGTAYWFATVELPTLPSDSLVQEDGTAVVPASQRYDLANDLETEGGSLGYPGAPYATLYLDDRVFHGQDVTFRGPDGVTLVVGANGTVSFPGKLRVGHASADAAHYPHEEPPRGISCWDADEDGNTTMDEDENDDGIVDVFDCWGKPGETGPRGPMGPTLRVLGPRGPEGRKGATGTHGFPIALSEAELPRPGPCPEGGRALYMGLDDGHPGGRAYDGVLQREERDTALTMCYGAGGGKGPKGPTGFQGESARPLLVVRPDEAVDHSLCPHGGHIVLSGWDDGADGAAMAWDGVLSPAEQRGEGVLCVGPPGDAGQDGSDGVDAHDAAVPAGGPGSPNGSKGAKGGQGAAGKDGLDGYPLLVRNNDLAPDPGVCALGGKVVRVGPDGGRGAGEPSDGVLHDDEVTSTSIVCVGERGPAGVAGTKWNHTKPDPQVKHDIDPSASGTRIMDATMSLEGFPVVFYRDPATASVRLAVCTDLDCAGSAVTTISSASDPGADVAVAISPQGTPLLAYTDATGDLWFVRCKDMLCTAPSPVRIDTGLDGSYPSVMDMVVAGHGCATLVYAKGTDLWTASMSKASGCTNLSKKLVLDRDSQILHPHIRASWNGTPVIVVYEGGSVWHLRCRFNACGGATPFSATGIDYLRDPVTPTNPLQAIPMAFSTSHNGLSMMVLLQPGSDIIHVVQCNDVRCNTLSHQLVSNSFRHETDITVGHDGLPTVTYFHRTAGLQFLKCHDTACKAFTATGLDASGGRGNQVVVGYGKLPMVFHNTAAGHLEAIRLGSPYGPANLSSRG